MTNQQYITAEQARKLTGVAHDLEGPFKRTETIEVLQSVREAAEKGKSTINSAHTDEIIVQRLKKLGYKIHVSNDQRDGSYMTVSW